MHSVSLLYGWILLFLGPGVIPSGLLCGPTVVQAWEWPDSWSQYVSGSSSIIDDLEAVADAEGSTLTFEQVSDMRVRDIKWRLARRHGYSADELGRMLDKKELIEALAFEEDKERQKHVEKLQRTLVQRGIVWGLVAIALVIFWPLLQQAKEVALVNFVVYTDRKSHEARRCWELKSPAAMVGIALMFVLDLMQLWLTASVLLSWVIARNKYFFPIPNIPVRPAQFMGNEMNKSFGGYGINVGSMAVTWGLRFSHGRIEAITARFMLAAQKKQRKEKKASGGKSNSKGTKKSKKKAQEPPTTLPEEWMEPTHNCTAQTEGQSKPQTETDVDGVSEGEEILETKVFPSVNHDGPAVPITDSHLEFLNQLNDASDTMNELD